MKKSKSLAALSNTDRAALKKAIKETPTLQVVGKVSKTLNKGFSDTPLFSQEKNQTKLF